MNHEDARKAEHARPEAMWPTCRHANIRSPTYPSLKTENQVADQAAAAAAATAGWDGGDGEGKRASTSEAESLLA